MVHRNDAKFSDERMVPNNWHSIRILVDRKKKSASLVFRVRLADRDEFDILTWLFYNILPHMYIIHFLIFDLCTLYVLIF